MSSGSDNKSKVRMSRRYLALIQLLNKRLNHFPSHEQNGLALVIRQKAYSLCDFMIETQKRPYKMTHINNLDIAHEQMRMHLFVASQQGYFGHPVSKDNSKSKEELNSERFASLTVLVDEFGSMIGGWKNKIIEDERSKKEAAGGKQAAS